MITNDSSMLYVDSSGMARMKLRTVCGHWRRSDGRLGGLDAVADIEAELERVAQLRSCLPTNVQPGQYASALEAHLLSVSKALQLELEQAPGTTGTRRRVSPPCRPPPANKFAR
jgi:hypothetical protein